MFGSHVLDLVIGLGFIYLLFALACTALNEFITGWWDHRRGHLERGIQNLLNHTNMLKCPISGKEDTAANQFYAHPLIKALQEDDTPPSYIPPATFARALIDLVAPLTAGQVRDKAYVTRKINENLEKNSDLQRVLLVMIAEIDSDISELNEKLEIWFNHAMDRVSGWYKRHTQKIVVLLAAMLVVLANADTLQIARQLASDSVLREALASQAEQFLVQHSSLDKQTSAEEDEALKMVAGKITATSGLGLPLGWEDDRLVKVWTAETSTPTQKFVALLSKIAGMLITIAAASLGAPFWFDILNKFVSIRSVGKSPRERDEQAAAK